jgi:DNA polymerase/3'-5' exonuclease PolX
MATDFKQTIIDNMKAIRKIEQTNKQFFKVRAYNRVIKELENFATPIYTLQDLDSVPGIGEGIRKKLVEIFETGFVAAAAEELTNLEDERVIETLTGVMNIGPVKARELFTKHNIRSIAQLRESPALLNAKQLAGLTYYEDFLKRIPRKEMDKHNTFVKSIIDNINASHEIKEKDPIIFEIAGSYRRGVSSSGDIDVLVSCTNCSKAISTIVDSLKSKKYVVETFANGDGKYMGACRLPRHKTVRRLDIVFVPSNQYPFALLYFTGSQAFNIAMRKTALEKGLSLSEHGLKYTKGPKKGEFMSHDFQTEADVFTFLGMPTTSPTGRNL